MAAETYVQTIDSLGVGSFPEPVDDLLDQLAWTEVSIAGLERVVCHQLGIEDLPEYFRTVIETRDWDDQLDRQLLGTICTFLYVETEYDIDYKSLGDRSDRYIRFIVQTLDNGREISLVYPGYKNRFDYDLRVDDWYPDESVAQSPRHWHLFSDVFWKFKQARAIDQNPQAARDLCIGIDRLYRGASPRAAVESSDFGSLTVGRTLEVLFGILPWFFMEEDINYPYRHADGKDMPYRVLNGLGAIQHEEFTTDSSRRCTYSDRDPENPHREYHALMKGLANYEASLQDNCAIVKTVHSVRSECP